MENNKKILDGWKNIRVSQQTRERLMFRKVKHQYVTYDGLINFLLDVLDINEKEAQNGKDI